MNQLTDLTNRNVVGFARIPGVNRIWGILANSTTSYLSSLIVLAALATASQADDVRALVKDHCLDCHDEASREGGLDLTLLSLKLDDRSIRNRWIHIYDRVEKREMPPITR